MKDIRPALRAWLLADAAISALVGGARIYPAKLPQGQRLTSIVYNRISEGSDYHMQGSSGLADIRMQLDCWATSQDLASALANLVKDRMDALSHTTITWGANSVVVQGSFLDQGREDYDDAADMNRTSRDYVVFYEER